MHESFLVHPQLCFDKVFLVSFVFRVPGLEEGLMFSGKALGWTAGTLIWTRRANMQGGGGFREGRISR